MRKFAIQTEDPWDSSGCSDWAPASHVSRSGELAGAQGLGPAARAVEALLARQGATCNASCMTGCIKLLSKALRFKRHAAGGICLSFHGCTAAGGFISEVSLVPYGCC